MNRCGCANCIEHRPGCGVDVDYDREDGCDIYTYSFDGECIAGNGLWWDDGNNQLNVKLRADGGLAFDNNGALYTTTKPDCPDGASVAALEARLPQQDVVVGNLGAGHMFKPQVTRRSFEYAVERGLDAVHVPVRMLADGTAAVTPESHLTVQNGSQYPHDPPFRELQVQHYETWRRTARLGIGTEPDTTTTANTGWFGYLEQDETESLLLADVLRIIGDHAVVFVHLMWPPTTNDGTTWAVPGPTPDRTPCTLPPDSRVDAFLNHVRRQLETHRAQRRTVVISEPTIPTASGDTTRAPLQVFSRSGITVAPYIASQAAADQYPPDAPEWSEWDWVVMGSLDGINDDGTLTMAPPERMKPFTSAGKYGLWYQLTRHSERARYMTDSGALGAFSTDPEYTLGGIPIGKHCADCGDTTYRRRRGNWHEGYIEHGLLPRVEDAYWAAFGNHAETSPHRRGMQYGPTDGGLNPDGTYSLGKDAVYGDNTYWVLQGHLELENPDNYRLLMRLDQNRAANLIDGTRRVIRTEVGFAFPHDQRFVAWGDNASDNHGYILSYSIWSTGTLLSDWQGMLRLWVWDPAGNDGNGANHALAEWEVPNAWITEGCIGIQVLVSDARIWVAPVNATTWQPISTHNPYDSSNDTEHGHLGAAESGNRGRSVFFGRGHDGQPGVDSDPEQAQICYWENKPGQGDSTEPAPLAINQPAADEGRGLWGRVLDVFDGE